MRKPGLSRRSLLQLGLGAAAAVPLLRFSRGTAAAASGAPPLRLVLFPSMNGADPSQFWPSAGNLAAMSPVTEPLKAYQSQMTFVKGLNIEGSTNHFAVRSIFSGFPINDYLSADPTVKSVDQVVAEHFAANAPSALRSLHLGAIPADSIEFYQLYGRSTFFFAPSPVAYEANPVTAFDKVFGGLGAGGGGTPAPGAVDHTDDVLAITRAELGGLGARVAKSEREAAKVKKHEESLAGLGGGGGSAPPPASCDATPLASVEKLRAALQGKPAEAYKHAYFSDIMDAQIDVMARALVCGLTRVATLQAGSADGNVIVPVDGGYPHHNTSHGDPVTFGRVQRWYAEKLLRLVKALDVPDPLDPTHTVLHNSAIVWLSECLPQSHGSDGVPCFVVGKAGGSLRTGGLVDVAGASNKALLKTLSRVMGVSDGATGHFGGTILDGLKA
jgi:hypothetical protein